MLTEPTLQISVLSTNRDFFDYCLHDDMPLPQPGSRVWVPFRTSQRLGIVVGHEPAENRSIKLRPIASVFHEEPIIPQELLALCRWISRYYHAPLAQVLALALPKIARLGKPLINLKQKKNCPPPLIYPPKLPPLSLHPEQQNAVDTISQHWHTYGCYLLHGVTGSGKTEVYLHLIEHVLSQNGQVLILVPEIGLTPQLLNRFNERFHVPIAVIHSHITDTERARAWQLAKENTIKIIIGTRSALFTPMPSLQLIIIDEEHDASLKQMEGVRYSARDAALIRAQLLEIPIVLGSATPSLESLHNCEAQKYTKLRLTHKALNTRPLHVQLIDIRNQPLKHGLAEITQEIIAEYIEKKEQVLIFINRRGFAPVLLCHQCGWMADCKACDCHLTFHRRAKQLLCHHCGGSYGIPSHCPTCKSDDLIPVGAGTQRIHQALAQRFPSTHIVRIDRDEVRSTRVLHEQLSQIQEGAPQIIIGTQMLAKGHHFPLLTLVVVLDTDAGFYNQDFRALERLGQLLTQVAGRAGRDQHPGRVLIQTHFPQHTLLNRLVQHGYDAFTDALLPLRQGAEWPPYTFLALIRAHGKTKAALTFFLNNIKKQLLSEPLSLLGPASAPLARKAGNHHMQLLIKSNARKPLHQGLNRLREHLKNTSIDRRVRWSIDIDPIDLA
jgi:primosomal protein N' (replication factor Y)